MAEHHTISLLGIQKSTEYLPYYLAHRVEPLLPFDLVEATYLALKMDAIISTKDLIAQRAKMLQKQPQDLLQVCEQVLKSRWEAVKQLEKSMKNKIHDFDHKPGLLVIVRNSQLTKPYQTRLNPTISAPWW